MCLRSSEFIVDSKSISNYRNRFLTPAGNVSSLKIDTYTFPVGLASSTLASLGGRRWYRNAATVADFT